MARNDPKPCPTCYSPMRPTPEGFACDRHGVPKPRQAPPRPPTPPKPPVAPERPRDTPAPRERLTPRRASPRRHRLDLVREAVVARNEAGESLASIAADLWQELGYANQHICSSKLGLYLRKHGVAPAAIRPGPPPGTRTVSRYTDERYAAVVAAVDAGTTIWSFAGAHWEEWGFASQVACDGLIRKWLKLKRRRRVDDAGRDRPGDSRDADPAAA